MCSRSRHLTRLRALEIGVGTGKATVQFAARGTSVWDRTYSSDEYVRLLGTHSDHILLEPGQHEGLYAGVSEAIDRNGGTLALTYLTRLCLARAA